VRKAVADYKAWVVAEVDGLVADTAKFTDAVRAGDLAEAKRQYAPSRVRWERIEPIAGLVEEIDGKVDARVDDFEGVTDPEFTGWHRLEYHLWEKGSTKGTKAFADGLDKDIATLDQQLQGLEFPPAAVALGPAELIEEVSEGKITGEEDRYSRTDLWDFDANVDGSRKLFELLNPGPPGQGRGPDGRDRGRLRRRRQEPVGVRERRQDLRPVHGPAGRGQDPHAGGAGQPVREPGQDPRRARPQGMTSR
jgi:iron uptake system component EfeO